MKVAVIGANGQLGSDITSIFKEQNHQVIELNHDVINIVDLDLCKKVLSEVQPDLVINTAAYHNVDKCEIETVKAFEGNALGARNLAILSNEQGFKLYHISTDYIFSGSKQAPYLEDDAVCPVNVYGNTKASGEFFVRSIAANSLVIRVSAIYGKNPCRAKGGNNFVNLMLKLGNEKPEVRVVAHEFVSPTPTMDIARQLAHIASSNLTGICHATSESQCSWYEFAQEIFRIAGIKTPLNIAQPGEFAVNTPRPFYSVLENNLLKKNGLNIMRDWREGLKDYLSQQL